MKNPFKKKEPTPPSNPVAERLYEVAAFIEEHGWTQGSWYDSHTGKVCLEGALEMVSGKAPSTVPGQRGILIGMLDDLYLPAHKALTDCVEADTSHPNGSIVGFNDANGRTEDEVLRAVRECADRQRAKDVEAAS